MPIVVGVAFKAIGKIHQYDPGDLNIAEHDNVVVEAPHGSEFGFVKVGPRAVPDNEVNLPLLKVLPR